MKACAHCGAQLTDDAAFCPNCGAACGPAAQPGQPQQPNIGYAYAQPSPYDHTAQFDPRDISENKVICMLVYLMGIVGVIIAMLASTSSPYVSFHVRQALKITVLQTLMTLATLVLIWTIIVPIAYGVMLLVLLVVRIICFVQICSGKAIEPAVVRSIGFLR